MNCKVNVYMYWCTDACFLVTHMMDPSREKLTMMKAVLMI